MKDNWAGVGLAWGWRGVGVGLVWGWCGAGVGCQAQRVGAPRF
jgi:hypothetical protein